MKSNKTFIISAIVIIILVIISLFYFSNNSANNATVAPAEVATSTSSAIATTTLSLNNAATSSSNIQIGIVKPTTDKTVVVNPKPSTSKVPYILYADPASGQVGGLINLYGVNFTPSKKITNGPGYTMTNTIIFDGLPLPRPGTSQNGTQSISFMIPESIGPNCEEGQVCPMFATRQITPGTYSVKVQNANGASNGVTITVKAN